MLGVTRRSVMAGAVLLLAACGGGNDTKPGKIPLSADTDIVRGDADAPLTLIEYASITCGACGQFHNNVLSELKPTFVETGKLKIITREVLRPPGVVDAAGFAVARCAGDDKYYDVLDDIFQNQIGLFSAIQAGGTNTFLEVVAGRHGLDSAAYEACIGDQELRKTLGDISTAGAEGGVRATPTLYLNGRELTGSTAVTLEGLTEILEAELARGE